MCSCPAHFRSRELRDLASTDITCSAPAIRSPLRKATQGQKVEAAAPADDDDIIVLGGPNIGLDLADSHGNRVTLTCNPRGAGPPRVTHVHALQPLVAEGAGLRVEATVMLNLACLAGTQDAYERVWQLLAYYGDVSAALADNKGPGSSGNDDVTAYYFQNQDDYSLYYTGLQVNLTTPPRVGVAPRAPLFPFAPGPEAHFGPAHPAKVRVAALTDAA